jgi:hypothetical protein
MQRSSQRRRKSKSRGNLGIRRQHRKAGTQTEDGGCVLAQTRFDILRLPNYPAETNARKCLILCRRSIKNSPAHKQKISGSWQRNTTLSTAKHSTLGYIVKHQGELVADFGCHHIMRRASLTAMAARAKICIDYWRFGAQLPGGFYGQACIR